MAAIVALCNTLLFLIQVSLAKKSTVLDVPYYSIGESTSVSARLISADSTATILAFVCPKDVDKRLCHFFGTQTVTYGPSTYHMDMSTTAESGGRPYAFSEECISSTICVINPGDYTITYDSESIINLPVTITAGGMKMAGAPMRTPATVQASATDTEGGNAAEETGGPVPSEAAAAAAAAATTAGQLQGLVIAAAIVVFVGG